MQKSEAAQEDFMKTERSYNFSTSKSIKSLLKLVGAGLRARPREEIRIQRLEVRSGAGRFYENRAFVQLFDFEKHKKSA